MPLKVKIFTELFSIFRLFCRADYICPFLLYISSEVLSISKQELSINEEIRDKEVRLIGSDGSQLGIVSAKEALRRADEAQLDLVKIAPNAQPPVCKIMDYGKYRFEQAKRENIDVHDFNTKVRHAERFIKDGNKVKVSIRFRGREMGHQDLGLDTMNRFAEACAEFASIEKPAKMEGRNMLMFLAPKKN